MRNSSQVPAVLASSPYRHLLAQSRTSAFIETGKCKALFIYINIIYKGKSLSFLLLASEFHRNVILCVIFFLYELIGIGITYSYKPLHILFLNFF